MPGLLTPEQIEANLADLRAAQSARQSEAEQSIARRSDGMRYVHPLSDAADAALEAIENKDERYMLGLHEIDYRTRGFGAKELVLVIGFAHSSKTQVLLNSILRNRDKRILFASLDDPAEMVLLKLTCMHLGVDAETLERQIKAGDGNSRLALRQAATHTFANLIVVDDSISLSNLDVAIEEATAVWGAPPQVVMIDYLASLRGEGGENEDDGVKRKAAAVKRWCKDRPFPTIVVHQNSRSRGAPGEPITMMSGGYGGEQEATFVLGVRRKRDLESLDDWQRKHHQDTVTLHLVKSKRPPGKLTPIEGVDLFLDPSNGRIGPLRENLSTVDEAIAARESVAA